MKPLALVLALSLAANGYFAVREHRAAQEASSARSAGPASSSHSTSAAPTSSASAASSLWQRLAHGDAAALVALRAAGWPEDLLQRLVTALIDERFRAQAAAFTDPPRRYWEENIRTQAAIDRHGELLSTQTREKEILLKALLGDSYLPPEAHAPALDGIPREKAGAVADIRADYAALRRELLHATTQDYASFEKQLALLEREERADIARVLTPEEFFEYELRNSLTASELRYNTEAFEPTEEEFRALFRIKNSLDEPAFHLDPAAARKLRKDTEAALDVQARTLLGEERFQQFVLSRDAEYRRFYHLSKHLDLPAETARTAYQLKADIDRRSRALDADPATTADERAALAQEAEARLTALYGAEGIQIYKHNSRYLDLLRRPPSERPNRR